MSTTEKRHPKKPQAKQKYTSKNIEAELESDLKELGLNIFGNNNENDVIKITKIAQDATKDAQSLTKTGAKISETIHNFSEDVLDNPDLLIYNIDNSGLHEAFWQLYATPCWENFSKLLKACSLILFPDPPIKTTTHTAVVVSHTSDSKIESYTIMDEAMLVSNIESEEIVPQTVELVTLSVENPEISVGQ